MLVRALLSSKLMSPTPPSSREPQCLEHCLRPATRDVELFETIALYSYQTDSRLMLLNLFGRASPTLSQLHRKSASSHPTLLQVTYQYTHSFPVSFYFPLHAAVFISESRLTHAASSFAQPQSKTVSKYLFARPPWRRAYHVPDILARLYNGSGYATSRAWMTTGGVLKWVEGTLQRRLAL